MTLVARGGDPAWPEVVCIKADGLTRCFRNQEPIENSPTVVTDGVVLDGWWIIGFANDGLSVQSGLTSDAGPTTLRRARSGDVEWFAVRLPDGATWAQGELSANSGSGVGGPWFRP